jgi:hypothetical protein
LTRDLTLARSFTSNEQRRFRDVCAAGRLTDAYRLLHPAADWAVDATWRGAPGVHGPPETGRYYNKGIASDDPTSTSRQPSGGRASRGKVRTAPLVTQ